MNDAATDALALLREDLRDFAGYRSARCERAAGSAWLNANEAAHANASDAEGRLRRYPPRESEALQSALAALYGIPPAHLLIGRGSDEAIDLIVRAFCRPGLDAVLVTPPVFGMYAVCARLQRAPLVEVPLREHAGEFEVDLDHVAACAERERVRVVFLCSPGNPAGGMLAAADLRALARRLARRAMLVLDEAYIEYADSASMLECGALESNLLVLRTLSKAHALAAARIGCAIGDPGVIAALRRCQAPYPLPEPSARCALAALAPAVLTATRRRIAETRAERTRLARELARTPGVRHVHASQANFLLVRFDDADAALARLLAAGVVVRDVRAMPRLGDAVRITIGTPVENDAVLDALRARTEAA
ncbi:MAG: histidinol-phosphate transaminase [Lysobacteraceae bacterium]|nr:MAG: histidinol-phosphate transaminase [Xanthomonadaceae bacterium]